MKLSLDWILDFVNLPKNLSSEEFGELITKHTAEVEHVDDVSAKYKGVVIGKIKKLSKHPDANRLNITQVDIGEKETIQIVCGGQNLKEDMLVAVALPGSFVNVHGEGLFEIKKTAIRGQESNGMICAGEEIWLEPDNEVGSKEDVKIKDLTHLKAKTGTPLAEALNLKGYVLDIDNKSLTHRPDLWSHYGFARECSAIWGHPLKTLDEFLYAGSYGNENFEVKIKNNDLCKRFSSCLVGGIKIEPSPIWMQARLEMAGMNPINNIVDITNYVMLELGQPMHAYDKAQVGGDFITVDSGKSGKKLVTLDGGDRDLHPEDPVIYNSAGEALTIAGIKGGLKSGINAETNEIILESANWDAIVIRKASTRHQLRTEASQRFEKSLDPNMTDIALKRALKLIMDLCPGAKVLSKIQNTGTFKYKALNLKLDPRAVSSKVGVEIPQDEMLRILHSLDFKAGLAGPQIQIEIPSHRAGGDVSLEEDIIEEIARIHGYDKIPAILPELPSNLPIPNTERHYKHKTRSILSLLLGFTETLNYSFYGQNRLKACLLPEKEHLKVLNYLSEDQTHMRISLVPNLLAVIEKNQREFENIKIFELGRIYKETGDFMPAEEKFLAIAITDKAEPFYKAKGALEDYLESLGIKNFKLQKEENPPPYAHPKKCLRVMARGQEVAHIFTVHPAVLQNFGIKQNTAMFELNFSKLMKSGLDKFAFSVPPKFPGMSFDLSVLTDERAEAGTLAEVLKRTDKLIESVQLFDIYQGKGIPEGKKSLSYKIDLLHKERTLSDEEFKAVQFKVLESLPKLGAELRA